MTNSTRFRLLIPSPGKALVALIVSSLCGPVPIVLAADCAVPGDRPTIQDALADYGCDPINLADQIYSESILIERAVAIVGPVQVAEIAGGVEVNGAGTQARLEAVRVDNGCSPQALISTDEGRVEGDRLEVVRTEGGPCPDVVIDLLFADGFESGNVDAWSGSNP